jgi:hypothetical protein
MSKAGDCHWPGAGEAYGDIARGLDMLSRCQDCPGENRYRGKGVKTFSVHCQPVKASRHIVTPRYE